MIEQQPSVGRFPGGARGGSGAARATGDWAAPTTHGGVTVSTTQTTAAATATISKTATTMVPATAAR